MNPQRTGRQALGKGRCNTGSDAAPSWQAEVWCCMRRLFALKLIGVTAVTWLFFLAYFHLLEHPVRPVSVMPLTALDQQIPFQPVFLVAYFSLWVYVGFAPGLLRELRALLVYGCWAVALCLTGLACFYFWPTQVPPLMRPPSDFPGFALLHGIDAAGNACPSMHVAAAVFSALCLHAALRRLGVPRHWRWCNALWCLSIAYSTLATKQHVLADALAGALLGAVFAAAALCGPRLSSRPPSRHPPAPAAHSEDQQQAGMKADVRP